MPQVTERMRKLMALLEQDPEDPFLLYGLAMEHKNTGDGPAALAFFDRVLARDPLYCYAYHQQGLIHESTGDLDAARRAYRAGIDAAVRKGDQHAKEEITAALEVLEG